MSRHTEPPFAGSSSSIRPRKTEQSAQNTADTTIHTFLEMAQLNSDGRQMPYRNLGCGSLPSLCSVPFFSLGCSDQTFASRGTGLMVSALSFGTMTLRDHGDEVEGKISRGEEAYELLEACYKGGVNFFDCAVSAACFCFRTGLTALPHAQEGYGGAGASDPPPTCLS
eukprot:COSAG04_NODE_13967_length_585_cov_1.037037_1_plen_168_part_00